MLTFAIIPEVVGNIAHYGLDKEHQADPLVPGMPDLIAVLIDLLAFMIDLIAFLIDLMDLFDQEAVVLVNGLLDVRHWANTWMSTRFFDLRWDGECALNPAVSVHDICNYKYFTVTKLTYVKLSMSASWYSSRITKYTIESL